MRGLAVPWVMAGAITLLTILVTWLHSAGHLDAAVRLGWVFGPVDSLLVLDTGAVLTPQRFEIVARRGCDLSPVDAGSVDGANYLTSFVWPFDLDRHRRLAAALDVVRQHPVTIDRAPASSWLREHLNEPPGGDVLTVVWQSITRQYWPAEESRAVDLTIAEARTRMPIVHLHMEGVPPIQGTAGYAIAEHGPTLAIDGTLVRTLAPSRPASGATQRAPRAH